MTTDSNTDFDIIIVGGGLVGASLAIMLRQSGFRIAVIEAYEHDSNTQPSYDDRTVALSHGSRIILDNIGVWEQVQDQVEPILTIHISDRGHAGVTRLRHSEEQVEALGYVAENRVLGKALHELLQQQDNVSLFCPAELVAIDERADQVRVSINRDGQQQQLTGRCLVAADGITSRVRQCLHIGATGKAYEQSAVITNVTVGDGHNNVAYERFTDTGPIAFLPMSQHRCSVVWTLPQQQAEAMAALDDAEFLQRLQQRFGYRLGILQRVGSRHVYPLSLVQSTQMVKGRTVIVGNAAHALHPVAGQGFNLALRDIATLVDCIAEVEDPGQSEYLDDYMQRRQADTQRVYRFTDSLIRVFSNNSFLLGHARAAGLMAVDIMPFVKTGLARQSMGITGRLSSMGRM